VVTCLGRGADLHMAQRMPLPLTNPNSSSSRSSRLVAVVIVVAEVVVVVVKRQDYRGVSRSF